MILSAFVAAALVRAISASPNAPSVTPAAVLPRADTQTLGWYSQASKSAGDTVWIPWLFDNDTTTFSTSSNWFRRCPSSSSCVMYTGCSNGYLVASSTSSYCGTGGGSSSLFCSRHVLYESLGASNRLSWYWCDSPPLTGITIYEKSPFRQGQTLRSSVPSTASAVTTSPDVSFSRTSQTAGQISQGSTAIASSTGSLVISGTGGIKMNRTALAGVVAGSVIGGVAVLSASVIALLVFFRRKRKNRYMRPPSPLAPEHRDQVHLYPTPPPPPPQPIAQSAPATASLEQQEKPSISPPPDYQSSRIISLSPTSETLRSSEYSGVHGSKRFSRPPTLPPPRLTESLLSDDVRLDDVRMSRIDP